MIIIAGALVYTNSLNGDFLWDDETLVEFNPYVKDWAHLPKILTSRLGSVANEAGAFYRPVQTLTYLIDYSLWNRNVIGYHVTNVFWHILSAICVFGLIQSLFHDGKLSLITALIFVVHPLHTEAVSYISGRADPIAAVFILMTFILYLKCDQNWSKSLMGLMAGCYLLALLSKEYALILPVLIGFYHFTYKSKVNKKAFITLIAATAAFVLWRLLVIGTAKIAEGEAPDLSTRLPGVFVALFNYFRLMVWPVDLHMEYGGILFPMSHPKAILGLIMTASILFYMFNRREKDRFLFFCAGWFFITLLPSSNLLMPINAYMAEHWLYVPLIGAILIVARPLGKMMEGQRYRMLSFLLLAGLLVFGGTATARQNRYWNNDVSFYKRMLKYAPDSSRLYNNLAKAYHDAGKNDELIELLRSAIKLQPDNALAHNNLGNAYKEIGKYDLAIDSYKKAIAISPDHAGPYYNISSLYTDVLGNDEKAIELLHKAIEMSPYFSKSYNKLGLLYFEKGKKEEALSLLEKALKLNPDDYETYHHLGYVHYMMGDIEKGTSMYAKSVEINPRYADGYYNLAVIYSKSGRFKEAIYYCDKAVALGYVDRALLEALKPYR